MPYGPPRGSGRPAAERFWEKVDQSAGPTACWPWLGRPDGWGYGRFGEPTTGGVGGWRYSLAHRVSWQMNRGPIPDGLLVRHICDNPPCVNPAHLELGTSRDNARDMVDRGRIGPRAGEANGHARLTEADVVAIRALRGTPRAPIAERFGIRPVTVTAIWARRMWRHIA